MRTNFAKSEKSSKGNTNSNHGYDRFLKDRKIFKNRPEVWLKKWMQDNKRTQMDIARAVGVTPQFMCDLMKGRRPFSKRLCSKLAETTNICAYAWWSNQCFWEYCDDLEERYGEIKDDNYDS